MNNTGPWRGILKAPRGLPLSACAIQTCIYQPDFAEEDVDDDAPEDEDQIICTGQSPSFACGRGMGETWVVKR